MALASRDALFALLNAKPRRPTAYRCFAPDAIRAIVARLNVKPLVRLEAGCFVAHLEGERYVLGKISNGFAPALRRMREVCGPERMSVVRAS